jgi:energy-coupling factor transporter transmembrane protein EcfT
MGHPSSSASHNPKDGRFDMVTGQSIFRYKTVKGPLHKLPALLKLLIFLPLSVFCMTLAPLYLGAGIIAASITAFLCKFTLREQLTDLKPAFFYAVLMYALSLFSNIFDYWQTLPEISFITLLTPHPDFLRITLRLVLIMQLSSLLFRSTSSSEIRYCLPKNRFTGFLSLFLGFIPEIFETWSSINLAWKARGGKNGIGKIKTVVFILITLSFEKAAVKAKALVARG